MAEKGPHVGVDGVGNRIIVVIKVGKNRQAYRKPVGHKQVLGALGLRNSEILVVVPHIHSDGNLSCCPLHDPVVIRADHGGKNTTCGEILGVKQAHIEDRVAAS